MINISSNPLWQLRCNFVNYSDHPITPYHQFTIQKAISDLYYVHTSLNVLHKTHLELITSDAELSCVYAYYVKHGKFSEGEEAISKSPKWAYYYAKYVIKDRFKLGEPAIESKLMIAEWYKSFLMSQKLICIQPNFPCYSVR